MPGGGVQCAVLLAAVKDKPAVAWRPSWTATTRNGLRDRQAGAEERLSRQTEELSCCGRAVAPRHDHRGACGHLGPRGSDTSDPEGWQPALSAEGSAPWRGGGHRCSQFHPVRRAKTPFNLRILLIFLWVGKCVESHTVIHKCAIACHAPFAVPVGDWTSRPLIPDSPATFRHGILRATAQCRR